MKRARNKKAKENQQGERVGNDKGVYNFLLPFDMSQIASTYFFKVVLLFLKLKVLILFKANLRKSMQSSLTIMISQLLSINQHKDFCNRSQVKMKRQYEI